MPDPVFFLTDSDRRALQTLIDRERRGIRNTTGRANDGGGIEDQEQQGPEVYVALVPAGGIPARVGIVPGSAVCTIYQIHEEVVGTGIEAELTPITGTTRKVWNLSLSAIDGGEYVPVHRDKFGSWLASASTATTGTGTGTGTGDGPPVDDVPGGGACVLARLKSTDCLLATSPDGEVELKISGSANWLSTDELPYFGATQSGIVRFWYAEGRIHLSVGGLELLWCGDGCFTGGPLTGHTRTGTDTTGDCEGEVFTVCVVCQCCSICGWEGAGWYCVRSVASTTGTSSYCPPTGTDCPVTGTGGIYSDCRPVELLDEDRCDDTIEICSGPYATEADANEACLPKWWCVIDDTYTGTGTCATATRECIESICRPGSPWTVCSGPYTTQAECSASCTVEIVAGCAECPSVPSEWLIPISGVSYTPCDGGTNADINGDWIVSNDGLGCDWACPLTGVCVGDFSMTLRFNSGTGQWEINTAFALYVCSVADFNCLAASTFTLDSFSGSSGWPSTLTIYPH